jgi:hypothetical protein
MRRDIAGAPWTLETNPEQQLHELERLLATRMPPDDADAAEHWTTMNVHSTHDNVTSRP